MTIQDKIEKRTINIRRKLADKAIKHIGSTKNCIRLKVVYSEFGDEEEIKIINNDNIDVKIVFPAEVPLFRYRASTNTSSSIESNTGVFLFDILPIEIFTKFEDNVEKDDFIIYDITDENNQKLYLILQITEMLGTFRKYLSWKKYQAAIYTGQFSNEIANYLNNLEDIDNA